MVHTVNICFILYKQCFLDKIFLSWRNLVTESSRDSPFTWSCDTQKRKTYQDTKKSLLLCVCHMHRLQGRHFRQGWTFLKLKNDNRNNHNFFLLDFVNKAADTWTFVSHFKVCMFQTPCWASTRAMRTWLRSPCCCPLCFTFHGAHVSDSVPSQYKGYENLTQIALLLSLVTCFIILVITATVVYLRYEGLSQIHCHWQENVVLNCKSRAWCKTLVTCYIN